MSVKQTYLKKSMVVTLVFSLMISLWFSAGSASAQTVTAATVVVDHKVVAFNPPPQTVNGRLYAPLRTLSQSIGATVRTGSNSAIIVTRGKTSVTLRLNNTTAQVNGKSVRMEAPAITLRGVTMVPIKFVDDQLGIEVRWDARTRLLEIFSTPLPVVTIEMDNGNKIVAELYPKIAPNTVRNFISLARKGYYNGIIFHRVIPGFMIQGGDPLGQGFGGPGYGIFGEFASNGFKNELRHTRGVLSMARSSNPNSAGSQFFIMVADASFLDGEYAAFGKVRSGMAEADRIVNLPRNRQNDRPNQPPAMKKVTVQTFGVTYPAPTVMSNQ